MASRRKPVAANQWVVSGLGLALAALAPAQGRPEGTPAGAESVGAQAQRLVRFLELPERRTQAWRGLLQLREAAAPPLALALQDPRPEVAVRAAWVLGLLGRDAEMALPALQRGAKGKEAQVALACRWALERIMFRGTLLADYNDGVVHLDEKGEQVRKLGDVKGAWFVEPTTSGNVLVSEFTANRVREVDSKGEVVWSFTDLSHPYQAQRLPGGTTLISDAGHGRIVEVDRDGKVVWELKGLNRPVAAERLPDGHTLITEQKGGRVHEIDADGRSVLEITGLFSPQRAQRLPNGNTLIAAHVRGEVIEVDASGKTVGEPHKHPQVQMALRRSDGHTLIASTKYWVELDAEGKEVWRRDGKYAVGILRQ